MNDDEIRYIEDRPVERLDKVWKVAVIDDDPAVHEGTRYALFDYRLRGDGIELLSAYSAQEGRELLKNNPDIAVILLDVVMETESAGLDLVEYIRTELKNEMARIILRTGQPGQAPERQVIIDYDINDYKAKTELTSDRLFTVITSGLRSYQQLLKMAETRRGLEIIVEAAATLFDFKSMQKLAEGVLTQLSSLLEANCAGILVLREEAAAKNTFSVLAASGCYTTLATSPETSKFDVNTRGLIEAAFQTRTTHFFDDRSIIYLRTTSGREIVVLLDVGKKLADTDRTLVEIFCGRLSLAFDNVVLYEQLQTANATLERRVIERTQELRSANERLQTQWMRARRTNAFQGEILSMVAHDIRNPLGVVLGRTEMIQELSDQTPANITAIKTQAQHIKDSAQRLTAMVSDLISNAMTDDFDISLRMERCDIASIARDVVVANMPLADKKAQKMAVDFGTNMYVDCDIDRMRDALDNLVSNAIKYTPQGGSISVEGRIEDREIAIYVRDSGPGLLPDDKVRLFGRFQRLSARPTGGEASTGLGLAITKRIVSLHGGAVGADSAGPGQGSTFSIRLRIAGSAVK